MAVSIFHTVPLILPTLVFHNTWVRKNRKKAPYEILNLLYNLWCFFWFRDKLQMLVDGAWEKDNIKITVCVCLCVFSPGVALAWLTLEIEGLQELRWAVQFSKCYCLQYFQYTPIHSAGCIFASTVTKKKNTEHPLYCLYVLCSNRHHSLTTQCLISSLAIFVYTFLQNKLKKSALTIYCF